eukprot:TRINITY_DN28936_c0_g1_i1.p1 TRINITY_DN28936_c0_g1~~TRINITY_DN28936_c0_g1_i1.p1  ORF type:complete len:355 (+),score=41.11 TRINITY_DN28936_c0_g1_i1:63-1127(+)
MLHVVLSVAALAGSRPKGVMMTPQFFNSSDCSGDSYVPYNISALSTGDYVLMNIFDGEYLQGYAIGHCLRGLGPTTIAANNGREGKEMAVSPGTQYTSFRLNVGPGQCATGGAVDLTLEYWASSIYCNGIPMSYNLSKAACVESPFGGSMKWDSPITDKTDLCRMQRYLDAERAASIRIRRWETLGCSGVASADFSDDMGTQHCSTEQCDGCCPSIDQDTCTQEKTPGKVLRYERALAACRVVNNTVHFGMGVLPYADESCTVPDYSTEMNRTLVEFDRCVDVESMKGNFSMMLSFFLPMTTELFCDSMGIASKYGLAPDFTTWNDLVTRLNPAPSHAPLLPLLFIALTVAFLW